MCQLLNEKNEIVAAERWMMLGRKEGQKEGEKQKEWKEDKKRNR